VGHKKPTEPILIQVKACYSRKLNTAFFGGLPPRVLDGEGSLFNSKPGFHADFIVSVSIKSPKEYRVFVLPVQVTERIFATKAEWTKLRTTAKLIFGPVWEAVLAHENAYGLLLGSPGKLEDIPSLLTRERPAESEIFLVNREL
jgi:hypothetical protein